MISYHKTVIYRTRAVQFLRLHCFRSHGSAADGHAHPDPRVPWDAGTGPGTVGNGYPVRAPGKGINCWFRRVVFMVYNHAR